MHHKALTKVAMGVAPSGNSYFGSAKACDRLLFADT